MFTYFLLSDSVHHQALVSIFCSWRWWRSCFCTSRYPPPPPPPPRVTTRITPARKWAVMRAIQVNCYQCFINCDWGTVTTVTPVCPHETTTFQSVKRKARAEAARIRTEVPLLTTEPNAPHLLDYYLIIHCHFKLFVGDRVAGRGQTPSTGLRHPSFNRCQQVPESGARSSVGRGQSAVGSLIVVTGQSSVKSSLSCLNTEYRIFIVYE